MAKERNVSGAALKNQRATGILPADDNVAAHGGLRTRKKQPRRGAPDSAFAQFRRQSRLAR